MPGAVVYPGRLANTRSRPEESGGGGAEAAGAFGSLAECSVIDCFYLLFRIDSRTGLFAWPEGFQYTSQAFLPAFPEKGLAKPVASPGTQTPRPRRPGRGVSCRGDMRRFCVEYSLLVKTDGWENTGLRQMTAR